MYTFVRYKAEVVNVAVSCHTVLTKLVARFHGNQMYCIVICYTEH